MDYSKTLNELTAIPTQRVTTGLDIMDWMWGKSRDVSGYVWGMPRSKVSIIAGEAGSGKSRLCLEIVKSLLANTPYKIVYVYNEVPEEDLGEVKAKLMLPSAQEPRMAMVGAHSLSDHLDSVKVHHPVLVVVDSINMMPEFKGGWGAKQIITDYRDVISPIGSHVIFISHVDKQGKLKGNTEFPHLADTLFLVKKSADKKSFLVMTGSKHRYGQSGLLSEWKYLEGGVQGQPSLEMFDDKDWTRDHSMREYHRPVPPAQPEEPFDFGGDEAAQIIEEAKEYARTNWRFRLHRFRKTVFGI